MIFKDWAKGYGVIQHHLDTQSQVQKIINKLTLIGHQKKYILSLFSAADRIANAAMWLIAHQTYANYIDLKGGPLNQENFKFRPQGHMGGSFNMVPAYVGYMLVNALTGLTRGWIMGQGHCVSAIDSVNLLLDNLTSEHASRYLLNAEGLTRFINDFYSYRLNDQGCQDSPLGSHVNIHTAGGCMEGGYLGFAELYYVHMPLPGESLVAFLSDGAFEEQRGSDWASHWWRAEDSGSVVPIMIFNHRRIDQRSLLAQESGLVSFLQHLKNYNFDPYVFDGTDPAAFACMIINGEKLLKKESSYPVLLPYGIAVSKKGAGFYGEGTNAAHSLPFGKDIRTNPLAIKCFNKCIKKLFVPLDELLNARNILLNHSYTSRIRERDHPIANRKVDIKEHPVLFFHNKSDKKSKSSPMEAIDKTFLAYVTANSHLRPRVGNPDEILSNRMKETCAFLKHRVTEIEPEAEEAIEGKIITALNEEAVACACLANKAGINIIVTYEAFAVKMLGAIRQEIVWSDNAFSHNKNIGSLSVPLVLTSHVYENSKNERSHQDTTLCEALLNEPSHISRVLFPADYNSAMVSLSSCYHEYGKIFTLVVPKYESIPDYFDETEAKQLIQDGIIRLPLVDNTKDPNIILTAIGSYQLSQVLHAAECLSKKGVIAAVNYIIEPGRFRAARSHQEELIQISENLRQYYYPGHIKSRIFVSHTRPEIMSGILRSFDTGNQTSFLGFINQGGTLDTSGMLFVNRQSWAHIIYACARILKIDITQLLTTTEIAALNGNITPHGVIF